EHVVEPRGRPVPGQRPAYLHHERRSVAHFIRSAERLRQVLFPVEERRDVELPRRGDRRSRAAADLVAGSGAALLSRAPAAKRREAGRGSSDPRPFFMPACRWEIGTPRLPGGPRRLLLRVEPLAHFLARLEV